MPLDMKAAAASRSTHLSRRSENSASVEAGPLPSGPFGAVLADPPWRFANSTGKGGPEHRRLARYRTMPLEEIAALPVQSIAAERSHCYLWCPNALLGEGLKVLSAWGFTYKTALVWIKRRSDGGPDGRGMGFYFRNVTELILFGVRGGLRTLQPGRRQVNIIATRKREHSRKPDELYEVVEQCSPGPWLEMFARRPHSQPALPGTALEWPRPGWAVWGSES